MEQGTSSRARSAAEKFCRGYGFDAAARKRRLALLELTAEDHVLAQRLHDAVIAPQVDALVERFYEYQQRFPEIMRSIGNRENLERLKATQHHYLLSLGLGFDGADYFSERLRVGAIHAARNIALSLYQASYRAMQQMLITAIAQTFPDNAAERGALSAFVLKITALDMTLAVETYNREQMAEMEHTLEELNHERQRLSEQAEKDGLTGLSNRSSVLAELELALKEAGLRKASLCLIMADIDHFKRINDTHGHLVGDQVLMGMGALLNQQFPDSLVARFGGEEFVVLLHGADVPARAEALRGAVESLQPGGVQVTISIGMVEVNGLQDLNALLGKADCGLYEAKAAGRNRVVLASPR